MNGLDYKKILLKNLWWLGLIVIAAIWLRLDFNFNSAFPLENATMLKGNLVVNSEGTNIIHDNYSLPFFTFIYSFGGLLASRITSLILSMFMLFFFYKFTNRLFEDKLASVFAVIFFAILAPIIFLGKFASVDMLSLTLFSAFLMVFAEIITSEDRNKKVPFVNISKQYFCPVSASILFILAGFSGYVVFLYFFPALIILLIKDRKSALYFLLSAIVMFLVIYFLNSGIINHQISSIVDINNENIKLSKLFVRIAEYIAIPLMLTFALQQMIWKTSLKNSMIFTAISISLIIPLYILLSDDVFSIYRLIPFSLIVLAPFCGLIISKFILINPSYKYSTIFAMGFIIVVSYWHLTKLESAYPNTDTIVNYCKDKFEKNTIIYSEDPYLLSNNFYQLMNIKNFKNIYYLDSKHISLNDRKEFIINQIDNGMIDYVILNGLFHKEFTVSLKEKYLRQKYIRIMTQEFTINTLMYPIDEEEGTFEIYKIEPEYRYMRQYLTRK